MIKNLKNRTMKSEILKQHGIEAIELANNVVIAKEDCGTLTNVTNWSMRKLYEWLGY